MIPAIQPMVKTSYTERGNEYKESNIGKYAAAATATGAAVAYGGEAAFKSAKRVYKRAKTIKLDLPKIEKPNFKEIKQTANNLKNKIPNTKSVKDFIKAIPAKTVSFIKKAGEFIIDTAKKVNMENIKKAGKSVVDFVKSNAKKVNKENLQKTADADKKVFKQPKFKYAAGIVAGLASLAAVGYLADAIANKISAKKADKA